MSASLWIRRFHRWMSVLFTISVVATFIALQQAQPIVWMSYVPLAPLALLFFTGIYLFALPYFGRGRPAKAG